MENPDFKDMQGLIKRGYRERPFANFILLHIDDAVKTKKWISENILKITDGLNTEHDPAINIAFTNNGFIKLNLNVDEEKNFSREFREGMTHESRSRMLGDYDWDKNKPVTDAWEWSDAISSNKQVIHFMLMMYASTKEILENNYQNLNTSFAANGMSEIKRLTTQPLNLDKEHFGFHDGIAQPTIKGFSNKTDVDYNSLNAGEFVLGYNNQYEKLPDSPIIKGGKFDFGKNGTYLVMRQIEQKVKTFWEFMASQSKNEKGETDIDQAIKLASKMVGRWPSGAPLISSPDKDDATLADKNDFLFKPSEAENYGKCPVGSHVMRSNPRDFLPPKEKESIDVSNHHRILRRGRAYGKAVTDSMHPADVLNTPTDNEQRGLFFICLNANISRQYEFIQNTWLNNYKFCGLYNDIDPIAGPFKSDFTIQEHPVRKHITNIPPFIEVRGGAYFFLPSISALKFLAEN